MKKKNLAKIIVLLLSFLMPVGLSDWIYLNETSNFVAKKEDLCTINIYTRLQSNKMIESAPVESEKVEDTATGKFVDSSLTETVSTRWSNTYKKDQFVGSPSVVDVETLTDGNHLSETVITRFRQEKNSRRS